MVRTSETVMCGKLYGLTKNLCGPDFCVRHISQENIFIWPRDTNTLSWYKFNTIKYGKLSLRYEGAHISEPRYHNAWMVSRKLVRLGRARCATVGHAC